MTCSKKTRVLFTVEPMRNGRSPQFTHSRFVVNRGSQGICRNFSLRKLIAGGRRLKHTRYAALIVADGSFASTNGTLTRCSLRNQT